MMSTEREGPKKGHSEITRYSAMDEGLEPDERGAWVKFEDHTRSLSEAVAAAKAAEDREREITEAHLVLDERERAAVAYAEHSAMAFMVIAAKLDDVTGLSDSDTAIVAECQQIAAAALAKNPEQHHGAAVAESQAPATSEPGEAGVAPGQPSVVPEIPEGWKLVPLEPTHDMMRAFPRAAPDR